MARTRTAVNRTVLGAVGLSLFLAGSWLTATDTAFADRLPAWWPAAGTGTVLLDRDRLAQLRGEGWWTPTAIAASIGLAVLFALWSLGQSRSGRARRLALPSPGCTVRPQALAEALAARVAALPGIARSRAGYSPVADSGWRCVCASGWNRTHPRTPSCPPSVQRRRRPTGRRRRTRPTHGSA